MKHILAKLTLASLAAVAPASIYAQSTELIVAGRATIILNPAVLQQFEALGISVTDLSRGPMQGGTNILPALEGAIDLQTAFNEVVYGGGYQFKAGDSIIQIRSLTLDLVGPSAVFSGIVIMNDTFISREAIFAINATGPPTLPIIPNHGTISHDGLSLSFEQPFVDLINTAVGNSGLDTTTQIGTLNLFSVLVPLSGNSRSSTAH